MRSRLIVFAAFAAYFSIFWRYGFLIEDEGTLLFQLTRVLAGQVPYLDFHTGYTPGYFYLGAGLMRLLGGNTDAMRACMAVVNAASATFLFALGRRALGAASALVAPALWVAFMPAFVGDFASFNVPYPAWFATLAWVLVAVSMFRWLECGRERDRLAWLAAAGVVAAVAFAVKPNAGAFAMAGCTWVICAFARRQGRIDSVAATAASVFMAVGVWLAVGAPLANRDLFLHVLPCAAVAWLYCGRLPLRLASPSSTRVLPALVALAVPFVALSLLWVVPLMAAMGVMGFARDVLLIGSDAAALYYLIYPIPGALALGVGAFFVAFAVGGWLVGRGMLSVRAAAAAGVAALVTAAMAASRYVVMPEGGVVAITSQLEASGFGLVPLVHWGTWGALAWRASTDGTAGWPAHSFTPAVTSRERSVALLLPLALAMELQVFPRADFMHLLISVPLTLVMATILLHSVLGWWTSEEASPGPARGAASASSASRGNRWLASLGGMASLVLVTATVLVVWLRVSEVAAAAWSRLQSGRMLVHSPTVRAGLEPGTGNDLEAFARAAGYLRAQAEPGEPALSFPAASGLLFAAGLSDPVPHDYWYPGRPDHADEAHMLATLEAAPPRFVATLNDGWTFFRESPPYYLELRRFVVAHYELVARYGRFDVLALRELAGHLPHEHWIPVGPSSAVPQPRLAYRREAARRWTAGLTPHEARTASLEVDRRTAILRLRAIRDGGNLRATAWLVEGYGRDDARTHSEAVGAMEIVTQRTRAQMYRWADDFDARSLRPFLAPYVETILAWDDPDPRVVAFRDLVVEIAGGSSRDDRVLTRARVDDVIRARPAR